MGTATVVALNSFLLGQLDSQLPQNQQLAFFIESQARGRSGPDGFGNRGPLGAAGTLGGWISRGRLVGTDEETRSGAKKVSLSPAARPILLRLPGNRQPYTRTLPGLGEYRLIAIPGQEADVHITGLPLAELNSTITRLQRIEMVVFGAALLVQHRVSP